ncbi:MAG: class I SAM-dependent methyltransferase [Clostridiales bacterium]|nr:class I SAM-dependent methyltransferase [Clostridiales bacterium]
MPSRPGLEWTFDTQAESYAKMRPGYTEALYRDLFQYCPVDAASRALEIGIGGGQATQPVLQTGCQVTAVEYGERFTALCRRKFHSFPQFSVVTSRFEDFTCEDQTYDLIYSASAFHWIPEDLGYPKVFAMLKKGGTFARFANHPSRDKSQEALHQAIQKLYDVYMPDSHAPHEYGLEDARRRAMLAKRYGFSDIDYKIYERTRIFTAQSYVALLGTYSDHIALEERVRKAFFAAIEDTIEAFGNQIILKDTIDLQLARKP